MSERNQRPERTKRIEHHASAAITLLREVALGMVLVSDNTDAAAEVRAIMRRIAELTGVKY